MNRLSLSILLAGALAASPCVAFNPPTMGWSSWNTFRLEISEQLIKDQADAMVSTGLSKLGYQYINIDDGYWNGRAADGTLLINKDKFPNGMRVVADYIHKKGLKAGIYSDGGDNTCGSRNKYSWGVGVGFMGHETADCKTYFDDWDYDFIKVDWCGGRHAKLDVRGQYTKIAEAIRSVKKKGIVYNVCCWAYPGTWISDVADSWRTTGDIRRNWGSLRGIIRENLYIQAYTGGGHYNDMDMLELGDSKTGFSGDGILTDDEETTHMAYWCVASSPLLIGCDMRNIRPSSFALLTNRDLLAMNQDKLGLGAPVVQRKGEVYVVAKDMEKRQGPKRAVVVMNLSDAAQKIDVSLDAIGFADGVKFYDCISHQDVSDGVRGSYTVSIPAHGSRAFFVTGPRVEKKKYQAEEAWLQAYQELGQNGTALYLPTGEADGGEYVGSLGHDPENYLEWRDVYSEKGGRYTISVSYAAGEPLGMTLSVNGEAVKNLTGLNSGDYRTRWSTVDVDITLNKGMNTIRLSNPTDWMPNIDCMTLTKK